MSLERFALTGSPPLLPGLQVVASAFEGVTVRVLAWLLPSAGLSHCPCPSPEPAALELSVSVHPHRSYSLGGAPSYHDCTQNAQHRTWHTGGEAGPAAGAAAREQRGSPVWALRRPGAALAGLADGSGWACAGLGAGSMGFQNLSESLAQPGLFSLQL